MCTLVYFCMEFGIKEISRVWELSKSVLLYSSVCNSLDIKKKTWSYWNNYLGASSLLVTVSCQGIRVPDVS